MIHATKEEIGKAYEAKATELRNALEMTMEIMDNYEAAVIEDTDKETYDKAKAAYRNNIVQYAENNDRLSLEFSKIAGLALYHELPVDEKTLSLALNYVNRRHGK